MSGNNFLARWSRRKREQAAEEKAAAAPASAPDAPAAQADSAPGLSAEELAEKLKSLPKIEDLSADHDLTAFMQGWVPEDVRNQALRRMWSVDPSIRDFVAPESERYDFDKPGAMFSHGPINMVGDELRAEAERLLASWHEPAAADTGEGVAPAARSDDVVPASPNDLRQVPEKQPLLADANDSKGEGNEPEPAPAPTPIPRRHGGATPS
jgi:hypothetical protein